MSMTGYERIKALLEGKPIDRSPIASWYHFPLVDHNITDFSRALICSTDFFGWDFIKIMTCGHFMTEAYGADITYSTNPQQWYGTVHRYPVQSTEDLWKVGVLNVDNPMMARELEIVRILAKRYKGSKPIIATIFNPITSLQEITKSLDPKPIQQFLAQDKEAVHAALKAIHQTNLNYLDALIEAGIDGIFLANQFSQADRLTDEQYAEFVRPYDDATWEYIKGRTWFNMAHVHGTADLRMDQYFHPDLQALNWECCPKDVAPEHTASIAKVAAMTDQVLITGIDQRNDFLTPCNDREAVKQVIRQRYETAVREKGDNRFVFATGCGMLLTNHLYLLSLLGEVVEEYRG